MGDIPIIFSGAMVRALRDGRKTMTRRLAWRWKEPPKWWLKSANCAPRSHYFIDAGNSIEHSGYCAREAFERLWDALHGPESWTSNPEVVVLTFARTPERLRGGGGEK